MSVILRKVENRDGTTSLYLDIYRNRKRYKEFLKECKLVKAANPLDRQANKEKMALAKSIAVKRAQELESNEYNVIPLHKSKVDFIQYFESYIERYTKKDKRNMQGVYGKFKEFMIEEGISNLSMKQLNENIIYQFAEYLKSKSAGEGAGSYFARFKKMLKQAVREKILLNNPASEVTIRRDESIKKDVLTIDEIGLLAGTPISNNNVKNAFLFSCFTGLRWVDVIDLKWKHINLESRILAKIQSKTDIKVNVHLHDTALALLSEEGKPNDPVFTLPSHTGALKTLRNWVKKAEIQKHITWHCARHSFATNLIYYKTDVTIVSKLMGHTGLKYTLRYTHIADELKRSAINNLPTIELKSLQNGK